MTEAEAKEKWCCQPFIKKLVKYTDRDGDKGYFAQPSLCIASDCMAWRWEDGPDAKLSYCGIAGKP